MRCSWICGDVAN